MVTPANDVRILRELAESVSEIAHLPVHEEKRRLWRSLNGLRPVRPMVWINEEPWDELRENEPELTCVCEDPFARSIEDRLRRTIYLWNHLRADRIVDSVFTTPIVYHDSGYGIERSATLSNGSDYGLGSCDYLPIMRSLDDIERIRVPFITVDWEETERIHDRTIELIGDILPVKKRGITHMWCAPWDVLIQWWGIEELMVDMYDRPELVNAGISRMMDVLLARLDQLEENSLLDVSDYNHRVGSGGLGLTDELPQQDYDGTHARPIDQWGTSTGQIFSDVSPAMHDEFCLRHEIRWLERFGLNCYGCCEPLHNKMGILRKVPRLRRISMSRWIDIEKASTELGTDYVFSYKPNPAVFAWDSWDIDAARAELDDMLERTRGNVVEIIMKDITTCRHEPHRIWQWCDMAVQVAENYPY